MSPPITRSDVLVERDFREPGDDLITGPAIIYIRILLLAKALGSLILPFLRLGYPVLNVQRARILRLYEKLQ